MPVYDELATVERAIGAVLESALPASYELLVVDDGSRDGTRELLRGATWPEQVRLLEHDRNQGKGSAIRTGLAAARGTYTTILDADLEYSPDDIPALVEPLRRGEARAVYGTRAFRSHSAAACRPLRFAALAADRPRSRRRVPRRRSGYAIRTSHDSHDSLDSSRLVTPA